MMRTCFLIRSESFMRISLVFSWINFSNALLSGTLNKLTYTLAMPKSGLTRTCVTVMSAFPKSKRVSL